MKKGGSKKTLIIMSLKLNEQFNWGESVVFSVNNIFVKKFKQCIQKAQN